MVELHQLLKAQLSVYAESVCLPALVLAPKACSPQVTEVEEQKVPTTPKGSKPPPPEQPVETVVQNQVEGVCDGGFCCVQWSNSEWAASSGQKTMFFCLSNSGEVEDASKGGAKGGKSGKAPAKKEEDAFAEGPTLPFDQGSVTLDAQEALSLCASFGKIRVQLEDAKADCSQEELETAFRAAVKQAETLLNPSGVLHPSLQVQASRPVTQQSSGKKSRPSTRGKGDKKGGATGKGGQEPPADPNALLCAIPTVTFFERLLDSTSGVMMSSGPECSWMRRILSMTISEHPQNNPLIAAASE